MIGADRAGVDMLGVVILRPPHLAHFGVSPFAEEFAEEFAEGRELETELFLPDRRG